ncbi:MAG: membrane protein insertion efficiency factor YidD [Patescibacteria group bacterium]
MIKLVNRVTRGTVVKFITLYQRTLSPDTGAFSVLFPYGCCRYYPTCSEYTKRAIVKHGVIRGFLRGAARLVRCNPFTKGGFDPVR